jgi:UDP-N-acetyl-D-mannosaminuronic acid dehydrogenase
MTPDIVVVGLGYIGLPTATAVAARGPRVVGVDVDPAVVEAVNSGVSRFHEHGLDEALADVVAAGRLSASTTVPHAQVYVVAVPTPITADRRPDVSHVESAVRSVAHALRGGELVILESTVPPGTTDEMAAWIAQERPDLPPGSVLIAHCPERVLPGRILAELRDNDRIIGGTTPAAADAAAAFYKIFCDGELLATDARTAELAKLVENSYRDVNIAFANELAAVCEHVGVDVWELIELANHHPRVQILTPGPGVGGHCIAVDPWFVVAAAPDQTRLIAAARDVNDSRPGQVVRAVTDLVARHGAADVAVLGLTFKRDVDDLRGSPALAVATQLVTALPDVRFHVAEPHVSELPALLAGAPNAVLTDPDAALAASTGVVLLVDHEPFRRIPQAQLDGKWVYDTRGAWRLAGAGTLTRTPAPPSQG